jgi:CRISPR/Cas system-associated endoribonuclease Cas2
MNDFRDLKAIAEACHQHQPLRFMRSHGALYIRNDNGIVFDVHQNRSFPEFMAQNKDYADLVLAANPATVSALIAEIERLNRFEEAHTVWLEKTEWVQASVQALELGRHRADVLRMRIDQLLAENEALRKERDKLAEDNQGLLEDFAGCL